jgi:hypothetical protein
MVRYTLDELDIPLIPGSRSITSTSGCYSLDISAVANDSINLGYCIQFQDTSIMAMRSRCTEHIIRELIEIELHPSNMNKEVFSLSKAWKLLLQRMKEGPLL